MSSAVGQKTPDVRTTYVIYTTEQGGYFAWREFPAEPGDDWETLKRTGLLPSRDYGAYTADPQKLKFAALVAEVENFDFVLGRARGAQAEPSTAPEGDG